MPTDWKGYQEETAEFFRSLGLSASTNVTLQGVRTSHDVDVLVTIDVAGFSVKATPTFDTLRTANAMLVRTLERMRDAGIDKAKVHEMLTTRLS